MNPREQGKLYFQKGKFTAAAESYTEAIVRSLIRAYFLIIFSQGDHDVIRADSGANCRGLVSESCFVFSKIISLG
jgi:hypothetical protein